MTKKKEKNSIRLNDKLANDKSNSRFGFDSFQNPIREINKFNRVILLRNGGTRNRAFLE